MNNFKEIEYSSGKGVEVWADSAEALFGNSAAGLYHHCLKELPRDESLEFTIIKSANLLKDLLLQFLDELNFRLNEQNEYFWKFSRLVIENSSGKLRLVAKGVASIVESTAIRAEATIQTIHIEDLEMEAGGNYFSAKLLFKTTDQ